MNKQDLKRSNEPPVWLMFSAGGMISAIAFPVLIFIVGILLPFGLIPWEGVGNIAHFAQSWFGKLVLLAVMIFPMWAGMHRVHHGLHDIKVHVPFSGIICIGLSTLYSLVALIAVIKL